MAKKLCAICLPIVILVGCTSCSDPAVADWSRERPTESDIEQGLVGKPAGVALDHFKVGFDDLVMYIQHWEFRAISFERQKGDHAERVFIWLDGKGTPPTKILDIDTIRKIRITEITTEQIDIEKSFVGKLAGEALDYYKVRFDDLVMWDEPPGCLGAVSFKVGMGEHTHEIYLNLAGGVTLFRESGDWDLESIRKAIIVSITTKEISMPCGDVDSDK